MEEEEEDLLKEALDGWSETEGEWRMAVKMKGQEVSGGKETGRTGVTKSRETQEPSGEHSLSINS